MTKPEEGVTWKEYVDAMLGALQTSVNQRFGDSNTSVASALAAAKEAVLKAENASDKRFEGVNEFRATLADQQRTLMPRAEAELLVKGLETRLTKLETVGGERRAQSVGGREMWAWIVGVLGAAAVLWNLVGGSKP